MALDTEDETQLIENAMNDEKEWVVLSKFLKTKYMAEVATFHDYNKKYQNEEDNAKRKELGDRMIVKFLTLDGEFSRYCISYSICDFAYSMYIEYMYLCM